MWLRFSTKASEVERGEKRHLLRNELMSFEVAAALAFERLFVGQPLSKNIQTRAIRIAHALAV